MKYLLTFSYAYSTSGVALRMLPGVNSESGDKKIEARPTSVDTIGVLDDAHSTMACGPPSHLAATI
jgi:hypothetical protein